MNDLINFTSLGPYLQMQPRWGYSFSTPIRAVRGDTPVHNSKAGMPPARSSVDTLEGHPEEDPREKTHTVHPLGFRLHPLRTYKKSKLY